MSTPDYNLDNYNFKKAWIRFRSDWRQVMLKAWSVRLLALATLLSFLEVVLPIIGSHLPWSDWWQALITGLIVAGAFVARFVVQGGISAS